MVSPRKAAAIVAAVVLLIVAVVALPALARGPAVGGGGGHTEIQSNNLSFPALLADGASISPIAGASFAVTYDGPFTGLSEEEIAWVEANGPWYAQKVEGNVWQAESKVVQAAPVAFIDWGDMIESVDPKVNRPYRLELGLYVLLDSPMTAYTMAELAYPSSPDETQGTNKSTYLSDYATVATPEGRMVVQRYEPDATLTWNAEAGQWDGAYLPEDFSFTQELNVGGKYIFGASTGGWKPRALGEYRITFYFEGGSVVTLAGSEPGDYNGGTPIIPKVGEVNTAVVDSENNISYVDVTVVQTGGGGGKHQ